MTIIETIEAKMREFDEKFYKTKRISIRNGPGPFDGMKTVTKKGYEYDTKSLKSFLDSLLLDVLGAAEEANLRIKNDYVHKEMETKDVAIAYETGLEDALIPLREAQEFIRNKK